MRSLVLLLTLAILAVDASTAAHADETATLAQQAHRIRDTYCARCHGQNGSAKGGLGYILNRPQLIAAKMIVPGKPDDSELLVRIREGSMPPEGVKLRPTPEEIAVLEKWIESGAPANESDKFVRPFRGERDILAAICGHLANTEPGERRYQRYFTVANLHNCADVSAQDLRLYRSALSKLVNNLSRERDVIIVPQMLDADGIVLAVDLRRLGWDKNNRWQELLQHYPYGLSHQDSKDAELKKLAGEVAKLSDPVCELPYVRADWFVAELATKDVRGSGGLAEPIEQLIRRHQRELGPEDVACELGLRDAKRLRTQLEGNRKLQDLGLAPIACGETIKRQIWESRDGHTKTLFQETAFELGLGTPLIP